MGVCQHSISTTSVMKCQNQSVKDSVILVKFNVSNLDILKKMRKKNHINLHMKPLDLKKKPKAKPYQFIFEKNLNQQIGKQISPHSFSLQTDWTIRSKISFTF